MKEHEQAPNTIDELLRRVEQLEHQRNTYMTRLFEEQVAKNHAIENRDRWRHIAERALNHLNEAVVLVENLRTVMEGMGNE